MATHLAPKGHPLVCTTDLCLPGLSRVTPNAEGFSGVLPSKNKIFLFFLIFGISVKHLKKVSFLFIASRSKVIKQRFKQVRT